MDGFVRSEAEWHLSATVIFWSGVDRNGVEYNEGVTKMKMYDGVRTVRCDHGV